MPHIVLGIGDTDGGGIAPAQGVVTSYITEED